MSISILVDPVSTGFRAKTGGPFDLDAEAPTVPDAVAALRSKIADRLSRGAVLIEQSIAPPSPVPFPSLADNPLFDEWLTAVGEYRDRCDADERLNEIGAS